MNVCSRINTGLKKSGQRLSHSSETKKDAKVKSEEKKEAQSVRPSPEKKPTNLFSRASRANDEQGNGHAMPGENQRQRPETAKVRMAPALVAKKFEPKHAVAKEAPAEDKSFDKAFYRTHDAKELRALRPEPAAATEEGDATAQNQKRRFAVRVQTAGLKMVNKPNPGAQTALTKGETRFGSRHGSDFNIGGVTKLSRVATASSGLLAGRRSTVTESRKFGVNKDAKKKTSSAEKFKKEEAVPRLRRTATQSSDLKMHSGGRAKATPDRPSTSGSKIGSGARGKVGMKSEVTSPEKGVKFADASDGMKLRVSAPTPLLPPDQVAETDGQQRRLSAVAEEPDESPFAFAATETKNKFRPKSTRHLAPLIDFKPEERRTSTCLQPVAEEAKSPLQ